MKGGRVLMIERAFSGVTCRGLGANIKPSASTPNLTAAQASSAFVMPQTLTLIILYATGPDKSSGLLRNIITFHD